MNDASQGEASGFGFTQARSYDGFRLAGVRRARKYERQRAFLNLVLIFYQRGRRHTGRVLLLAIQVATRGSTVAGACCRPPCVWGTTVLGAATSMSQAPNAGYSTQTILTFKHLTPHCVQRYIRLMGAPSMRSTMYHSKVIIEGEA